MKYLLVLAFMSFTLISCGKTEPQTLTATSTGEIVQSEDISEKDPRTAKCEAVSAETQARLQKANTNPDIQLDFLETVTILGDVSSCFLTVRISNPNDPTQADVFSLFDVVREKTNSNHTTLEALDAKLESIMQGLNNASKEKVTDLGSKTFTIGE